MRIHQLISILAFALHLIGCTGNTSTEQERPNILFILADDQRNDVLGCAGHPILKTPAIDQLAQNGVRFTNAFVTTSICAASRASILTGLYESRHGYTFGKEPLKKEYMRKSYPYLLRQAGYHTGFVGKYGVKTEVQERLLGELFDYYRLSPQNAPYFEIMPDGSRRHSAEIKGDQAVEYINRQSKDRPFCLSISFNAVHAVDGNLTPGNEGHYPYPATAADLYEGVKMPAPGLNAPEIFQNHPEFMKHSMNRERYFWRWDTEEKYQTNMQAYLRMISGYDKVITRVLEALKANGLDKNTVVIYSADNGYYMGSRGFAGKWSHYEESLRVPMIIFDPRESPSSCGITSDKMVLNIDIPATILDYAGIEVPPLYQGKSILPLVKGVKETDWRSDFFIEHGMDHEKIPKYNGVRNERYVYVNYYEQNPPFEYLHDLKVDSNQLLNLVHDSDYKDILQMMRSRCAEIERIVK
jgi:arylsulfatase A-like enzyme